MYRRYCKIANELLYLPKMNKRELIDWFISKHDIGFRARSNITVNELLFIYDNMESYADAIAIMRRDYNKIRKRIAKGEQRKYLAVEYHMEICAFNKNLKQIEKENVK
jgi:hypothetical protein